MQVEDVRSTWDLIDIMVVRRTLIDRVLGLPPAARRKVTLHKDLAVPMRDGAVLRADRYVPEGDDDAPLVVMRSPYGRRHLWGRLYCRPFAQRGYAVMIQSCRGTEDSAGTFVPFDERDDGADTVAWLCEQSWYPGRFVTFGPSYWGLAQWALADGAPEDLVAMVPSLTSSRLARSLFFGGAFSLEAWLSWTALIAAQEDRGPGIGAVTRARSRKVVEAMQHLPLGEADQVATGRTCRWWQEWLAHPDPDDPYWQRRDCSSAAGRNMPVAMVTSWQDLFAPWQLADWDELPAEASRRLVIAPWPHEHPKTLQLYMREALAWLDAQVHDDASGLAGGPVRYFVTGVDEWRDGPAWPPDSAEQRWYLQPAGGLSTSQADVSEPSRYRYDPADPTPVAGGPSARRNARVRQAKVEKRPDVLTFTSAALTASVEVVGNVRARVHLRSSVEHTDVVVRLCDVDRKGRSVNLCDGIRRLAPGSVDAGADGVRAFDVDLWPTGHCFLPGHRIRVQVASAAFPRFNRSTGTGEALAVAARLVAADQEVFHDPAHPSHIVLPSPASS